MEKILKMQKELIKCLNTKIEQSKSIIKWDKIIQLHSLIKINSKSLKKEKKEKSSIV